MKAKHLILVLAIALLAVSATAAMLIPANENAVENSQAPEHSPAIEVVNENWWLDRVDFIHYADGKVKPVKPGKSDTCFKLMGVKWSALPVSYTVNPSNLQGLTEAFITSAVSTSAEAWDNATSKELFNNSYGVDYTAQYRVQNYQNAIVFGDYPNSGVIAVTSVWYTRFGKQIVEFDMLFNTRFNWGDATVNPALMDLQNIATHELGHGVGLSDLYNSTCNAVTMYGYSTEGETSKRTLENADIAGLQKMYGA